MSRTTRCASAALICLFIARLQLCSTATTQFLNGTWSLYPDSRYLFDFQPIKVEVPGGIYTDLIRVGILPDIFKGYGDVESRWVAKNRTWTYKRTFNAEAAILDYKHQTLIFEGVDTFSTVHLNGKLIGITDNMFVRYELPIDGLIKATNNELVVTFDSPIAKSKELFVKQSTHYVVPPTCVPEVYNGECHVNHIRKMQASFAWDWGPAFPSVGLWKNVYIKAYNATYIKDVSFAMRSDGDDEYQVNVTVYMAPNSAQQLNGVLRLELENKHGVDMFQFPVLVSQTSNEFVIKNEFRLSKSKFDLWWPNGYGRQVLYSLTVRMISDEGETVSKEINVGFREVELVQKPVGSGLSFYFKINGLAIFAKGSNMVPSHILPENSNNETLVRKLMQGAKDVHMNMIRVWGGGLYESDLLYRLADEMGIMIWQDFMFACSMYPVNSEFLRTVEEEVEHQVRRLQHHPSIVLWAGNNENEAALTGNWYGTAKNRTRYDADYRQLYGKTIRDVVLKNDPSRKYLSSSPTNGVKSEEDDYISRNPGDNKYGDVHYYNYIFDPWDINIYPVPRFASEYGYQALPSYNSMLTTVADSSDLFINSKFMFHRQHHPMGNTEMEFLIKARLDIRTKSNDERYTKAFFFYSQIIQAMAVKIETEHYRQWQSYIDSTGNGMTMGALYWQLNCPWLAPTWSGVESTGRWKMLHYFAKNFFAPVIVTTHQHPNHITDVYIVSDQVEPIFNATMKITVFSWSSYSPVNEKVRQVDIIMGSQRLTKINIKFFLTRNAACASDYADCFVRLTLSNTTSSISPENFIYPVPLKNAPILFANVQVAHVVNISDRRFLVSVISDLPAAFVFLESTLAGVFSENGFMMLQQRRDVVFESVLPVDLNEFSTSLHVTHLRDKYYFS